jgi:hypothetical protein
MLRKIGFLLLISVMLLSSCSSRTTDLDEYSNNIDDQYNYWSYSRDYVCETNNAYYFMSGYEMNYLYIYDKDKKKAIPLCNKPDCKHTNETNGYKVADCNAFLGLGPRFLELYKDSIYYVDESSSTSNGFIPILYKISLDGTKREKVLVFTHDVTYCVIHRGYFYYATMDSKTDEEGDKEEGENKFIYRLFRQSIDNPTQTPELIVEGYDYVGRVNDLICYGDYLYYSITYYTDESCQEIVKSINMYDIQNKTNKRILENGTPPYTIFNDRFIYQETDGTYACDLTGENSQKITDKIGIYSANSKYLFIYNYQRRDVTILDNDFNVIKMITLDETYKQPIGCSNEYYFLSRKPGSNEYGNTYTISVLPLANNLQNVNPRVFYEYVPETMFPGVNSKVN